jgi:hypothetical protein
MRDTLQAVYAGEPSGAFARPDGIEERRTCQPEGGRCENVLVQRPEGQSPSPTAVPPPRSPVNASANTNAAAPVANLHVASGAVVNGVVPVQGSAWSSEMQFYSIEVAGAGGAWQSLGRWTTPVQGGTLGGWRTSGLPAGTYNLRVIVQDASGGAIASAPISVTIQ